jgi:hypothetical protein
MASFNKSFAWKNTQQAKFCNMRVKMFHINFASEIIYFHTYKNIYNYGIAYCTVVEIGNMRAC